MSSFVLRTPQGRRLKFQLYDRDAPLTCKALSKAMPFTARAVQAREAGEEIWIPKGPRLRIAQENATARLRFGEIGYAPPHRRSEIRQSMAIVYGEAKLWDCVNVFGRVASEDRNALKKLGEQIWLKGARVLRFERGE